MKISGAIALLLAAGTAVSAETPSSYLCVADAVNGFRFNKATKGWERATFSANAKYLLSKSKQPNVAWEIKDFGESSPTSFCKNDFNERGFLFCEGFGSEFRFNKNNLRYLNAYLIGYWSEGVLKPAGATGWERAALEEGGNTPNIEIGKCTPL